MLKIGLTGGIGSGKSFVGNVFIALGVPLYHADKEARRLMETKEIAKRIVEILGPDAYNNGQLNREYVASVVFNDKILLDKLNSIVHPAVQKDFFMWAENISTKSSYVLEEAALLFESGSADKMNYNIFVHASEKTRVQRIMNRDRLSEKEIYKRFDNQMDPDEKQASSDFVIYNEDEQPVLKQIVDLHHHITKLKE